MNDEPLILIPGMLCDERLWSHQVGGLGDLATPMVRLPIGSDSMRGLAVKLLEDAPARFALAGLSLGGYIAMEIMRIAPDRVTRLALLDTTPLADPPERAAFRRDVMTRSERGEFEAVFAEAMLPRLVHQDRLTDPGITDTLWGMARRIGAKTFVEQTSAAMSRDDYRPVLQSVSCPTVVICGRQDAICPIADHRLMAATVPGARFVAIEDCGHLSSIERPHAVTAVMQYWLQL